MRTIRNLMLILVIFSFSITLKAISVTFNVDMSEQTVSPLGVFLAGSFQGWNPTTHPMDPITGGGIYTLTIELQEGENIEYKFINGTEWEQIPNGCAQNGNRFLTIPATPVMLPSVCFGLCTVCNPPLVDVTFQVDMSNVSVSPNGVHLAADFQGWDPALTEMTLIGDNVYAVTIQLGSGSYHEYKFVNGNTWAGGETVPPECSSGWNRYLTVPSVSTTLDAVCFSSCYPCGPPPIDVEIIFQVDMSQEIIAPEGVHIAGGFQGWDPGATLMTDMGNGIWSYTAILPSGTYQEYKFINGVTWSQAEILPPECSNNSNRFFTVPDINTVFDPVCYNSCEPCPGPTEVAVTFLVDLSEQSVSPDGVFLSLKGGNPLLNPMVDVGGGIFSVTLTFTENDSINYKFANGLSIPGTYESVPSECSVGTPFTGGIWRPLNVPDYNTTIGPVCFGECGPCNPVMVTFRVDMTNEVVSEDGVHLAGSFQGWNASANPMTDTGNGIWETTIAFAANQYIEFKYINGVSFDFAENVPEECGVDDTYGGFNRFLTVPQENTILDPVCFGSCTPCVIPVEVEVTFSVDMSNEVISPEGVYIAGSFQGWISDSTQMQPAGDNIYTFTTMLISGEYYEFKYINGNDFAFTETVPEECSQNGNRYLTVPETGIVLDLVCFGECGACPALVSVTFTVDMSLQEVSPFGVHLVGDFQNWDPEATPMTSIGEGLYTTEVVLPAGSYQTYRYINGNSFESGVENVPEACGVDDGFGGMKRFLTVPEVSTVLETVCFGLCGPCPVLHQINLAEGWNSLSSYLLPDSTNLEVLFNEIIPELVVVQNLTGFYFPAAGTNTLGDWESQSAYQIKVTENITLTIAGQPETNKILALNEGWNLIPVISDQPVEVASLFGDITEEVIIVKEAAGTSIFWPLYSINTIEMLQPGRAYFVKMTAPATITFP